jgi:hypothetical protein
MTQLTDPMLRSKVPARPRAGLLFGVGLALLSAAPAIVAGEPLAASKGEAELALLLEGREAGEPVRCISSRPQQRVHMIDGTAYVFGQGGTLYVQRTARPQDIDRRNAVINQRFSGGELCRSDVISTVDPIQGFFTGTVIFDDFIPYRRVAASRPSPGNGR